MLGKHVEWERSELARWKDSGDAFGASLSKPGRNQISMNLDLVN